MYMFLIIRGKVLSKEVLCMTTWRQVDCFVWRYGIQAQSRIASLWTSAWLELREKLLYGDPHPSRPLGRRQGTCTDKQSWQTQADMCIDTMLWHLFWHQAWYVHWHNYQRGWESFWAVFWRPWWHVFWHLSWHLLWHMVWLRIWYVFWHVCCHVFQHLFCHQTWDLLWHML